LVCAASEPRFLNPVYQHPSTLDVSEDSRPILDFTPVGVLVQRALYHTTVLLDNFSPEIKAMLPLEASLGLVLAHAEIRAFRNYDHKLAQLYRSLTSERLKSFVLEFISSEIGDWSQVVEWKEIFYTLFEAGFYFSVVLPAIVEASTNVPENLLTR